VDQRFLLKFIGHFLSRPVELADDLLLDLLDFVGDSLDLDF
jgi:hypothetical protein